MKKVIYVSLVAGILPLAGFAQDQSDALRYSQLILGGTARFMSMSGAYTAVGGDASTLAFNPAGIAVFNRSQLTFTPGFTLQSTNATYNGSSNLSEKPVSTVENAAMIASWKNSHKDALWRSIDFGVSYIRTNNFNSNIDIKGKSSTSLLDQFVDNANGYYPSQLDAFSTQQAYYADGLIFTGNDSTAYFNIVDPFLVQGNYVLQEKSIQRSGSMGETDISFGGNYNNKLYLGASVGITDIRYNESAVYTETPLYTDSIYGLQSYNYTTAVNTTGGGVNIKLGMIYRIKDWLRIGAAVHTPTWFTLTDQYSALITANYVNTSYYPNQAGTWTGTQFGSPATGSYNYNLITPMRAMGGIAFVLHHKAIISADYEYVDYSTASLSSADAGAFSEANSAIRQYYMPASNLRVGGELVLFPFSIRAGYAYYGNPYTSSAGNSSIRNSFSGGFGIKLNKCFIDIAYVLTQYSENYYLYNPGLANATQIKNSVSDFVVTFGANL